MELFVWNVLVTRFGPRNSDPNWNKKLHEHVAPGSLSFPSQEQMWMDAFLAGGQGQELITTQVMPQGRAPPRPQALLLHHSWECINTVAAVTAPLNIRRPSCAVIGSWEQNISRSAGNEQAEARAERSHGQTVKKHACTNCMWCLACPSRLVRSQSGWSEGRREGGQEKERM